MAGTRLLQQMMILEEYAIFGGNRDVAARHAGHPDRQQRQQRRLDRGGVLQRLRGGADHEGYLMATVADGVKRQVTITGQDQNLHAERRIEQGVGGRHDHDHRRGLDHLGLYDPDQGRVRLRLVRGHGGRREARGDHHGRARQLTALAGTGRLLRDPDGTTDRSNNSSRAYNGLPLYAAANSSLAYYRALANGTLGTGIAAHRVGPRQRGRDRHGAQRASGTTTGSRRGDLRQRAGAAEHHDQGADRRLVRPAHPLQPDAN